MSCYKYWGKIEEIADKLSSYGDLDNEGLSALDGTDIDEITMILDEIEVIAHDKEIDFDSAKHIRRKDYHSLRSKRSSIQPR